MTIQLLNVVPLIYIMAIVLRRTIICIVHVYENNKKTKKMRAIRTMH